MQKVESRHFQLRSGQFRPLLHWALSEGRKEIAERLIANGADVQAQDRHGLSASSICEMGEQYEKMSFEELVAQLVTLSQESYRWGTNNRFPEAKAYPQYIPIRLIGIILHRKEGYEGMQRTCPLLRRLVMVRDGNGDFMVKYAWEDIGGWRP